ncbi:unnamed protein product [Acanthoscelides obtectus]|uniref:Uncharacterized protein n=1 Tax=Acanthoscelides obtectus TaxID=200917 RepID=A0A9P0KIS7_ACAOB|nr:unnamed protein product [Acanthoscelides obtectus]CAK1638631.1 hypothetical protein AOBTE_LOCUS10716 [Acanthoscelides obtectus]
MKVSFDFFEIYTFFKQFPPKPVFKMSREVNSSSLMVSSCRCS